MAGHQAGRRHNECDGTGEPAPTSFLVAAVISTKRIHGTSVTFVNMDWRHVGMTLGAELRVRLHEHTENGENRSARPAESAYPADIQAFSAAINLVDRF
jgi:hypothetical protein